MLSRKEQDMIINMMKPYSPIKIGVFGFVSHREETENCDIDIAYLIEGGIGFFEKCEWKEELENLLNREVDSVSFRAFDPYNDRRNRKRHEDNFE